MKPEERIESILQQLTLREKCALLSGRDNWRTVPIPRLGIESIVMTDGPHGVRATHENGRIFSPATSFPTGVSMAACWDPELIERVAEALAEETSALGCDVLLGPCVNIVRHPTAGRNFEAYSEDPYLAGKTGTAWVKGIQRKGVGASLKHYATNNQEDDRMRGDSVVDERTLREIYLAQFEMIVKDAQPWTVMCSYNRINGAYGSQNHHLLNEILKGEWGFDGAVISDWGANHTIFESLQGGLDLEMPGPAKYYGHLLYEAVDHWQIEEAVVTEAAWRMLRLLLRAGGIDRSQRPAGSLNTPEHQALARQLAEESITLLKNERDVLPLQPETLKSIAVIGPMADQGSIGGGGSSFVQPPYRVSPLEGLKEKLGDRVKLTYAQGCDNFAEMPLLGRLFTRPAKGKGKGSSGLRGEYFAGTQFAGKPALDRVDGQIGFWWLSFAPLEHTPKTFSVRWTARLSVPQDGKYGFKVTNTGHLRVFINDALVLENGSGEKEIYPIPESSSEVTLEKGKEYQLRVEYVRYEFTDRPIIYLHFNYLPPEGATDPRIAQAVEAARKADAALVFAGWPEGHESEGRDRTGVHLTGPQDELIRAVAAVNKRTVVVLNCGSPVTMPWADEVAGIIEAYYPGQEGGRAVASILLGEVNPSGKLTVTFPKRIEDTPAYTNFGPGKQVIYGEGLFVGYRHYDQRQVEPLFPFGHGLSYTQFEYSSLKVQAGKGQTAQVSLKVKNTGGVPGAEVVQLYVSDKAAALPRPPQELKSFARVLLQPGESQTVRFSLDSRAFAYYHPDQHGWVVEPGEFEIRIGASSRDIRLKGSVTL